MFIITVAKYLAERPKGMEDLFLTLGLRDFLAHYGREGVMAEVRYPQEHEASGHMETVGPEWPPGSSIIWHLTQKQDQNQRQAEPPKSHPSWPTSISCTKGFITSDTVSTSWEPTPNALWVMFQIQIINNKK